MNNLYVYDVEIFPNAFTVTIVRPSDRAIWRFEISGRVNQGVEFFQLLTAIKNSDGRMVGYNNIGFDYPVIHELIRRGGHITAAELYAKCDAIINSGDRFAHMVWESEWYVPQVDLFKIHHFDNMARSTSLKVLEFNMRSDNIQDLPFEPGTYLTDEQIDELIPYNDHDVFETVKFLSETIPMLEFRDKLSAKYNRNFTNHNDGKIGSDYFIMELERLGIPCYHYPNGRKEPRQTLRSTIALNDIILPWIQFQNKPFQLVVEWLRNQIITKTKGVFEFIEVPSVMVEYMDHTLIRVYGLTSDLAHNTTENQRLKGINLSKLDFDQLYNAPVRFVSGWKKKAGLNCMLNGFRYVFGTGGIHGSVESQIIYSDNDYVIIDLDVKSYYANVAIANGFYPEHLSEQFCNIYLDIYNQRKQYDKGTMENKALKYALNVPYGQSNSKYSPLFDSAYTMATTLNGQLLLCMLSEYLLTIPELSMIQLNTDGLTVRCPRNQINNLMFIAKSWEQSTGLELERADYNRMMIRDVNAYIGEYTDGKLKRKGAYCYGDDLEWHKNHSSQIVAIAAEAYLVRDVPIADTIYNHNDIMDFMSCTKVDRSSRLMLESLETVTKQGGQMQLQNVTRYYVSTSGGSLMKIMPPTPAQVNKDSNAPERRIGIDVGWTVTPCNNLDSLLQPPDGGSGMCDLNYDYYIKEAEKLVNPLRGV